MWSKLSAVTIQLRCGSSSMDAAHLKGAARCRRRSRSLKWYSSTWAEKRVVQVYDILRQATLELRGKET